MDTIESLENEIALLEARHKELIALGDEQIEIMKKVNEGNFFQFILSMMTKKFAKASSSAKKYLQELEEVDLKLANLRNSIIRKYNERIVEINKELKELEENEKEASKYFFDESE